MEEQEIKFKIAKEIASRQLTTQGINDATDAIYDILKEQLRIGGVVSSDCKCGRMNKCGERSGLCPKTGIWHS